jgi:signal transduction histidine kinase
LSGRYLDAQETTDLREQFIAVLAHDLRNPLTAIEGAAELLGTRITEPRSARLGYIPCKDRAARIRHGHGTAPR